VWSTGGSFDGETRPVIPPREFPAPSPKLSETTQLPLPHRKALNIFFFASAVAISSWRFSVMISPPLWHSLLRVPYSSWLQLWNDVTREMDHHVRQLSIPAYLMALFDLLASELPCLASSPSSASPSCCPRGVGGGQPPAFQGCDCRLGRLSLWKDTF